MPRVGVRQAGHEDITVSILEKDGEYEVDGTLGAWLLEHRKAEELTKTKVKHYGAQAEPELRHDDELAKEVAQVVDVAPMVEDDAIISKPKKRGRK